MEQSSKIPLLVSKNSFSIKLTGKTAEALLQQPRPILWNNDGLYCWIPLVKVVNQISIVKDKQKHAEANDLPFNATFSWNWDNQYNSKNIKEMAQAIEIMSQEKKENE